MMLIGSEQRDLSTVKGETVTMKTQHTGDAGPLVARLYSDSVCPFCFIAERSSLVRLQKEYVVAIDWRGFELHPETPGGGRPNSPLTQRLNDFIAPADSRHHTWYEAL